MNFTLHKKLIDSIAYLQHGKYAIAVSGGSDSLGLLYLCAKANFSKDCVVVHFDHNVRAESGYEADFVEQTAKKLGFKFEKQVWNVDKSGNFYQTARHARYKFFADIVAKYNLDGVIIAHSKTDLAETFLMRLTKGASLKGLSIFKQGVEIFGVKVYRPLLDFSREDIQNILTAENITWMNDPSNTDQKKLRPRVRNILSYFEDAGLSLAGLKEASNYLNQANDCLDYYTEQELAKFVNLKNMQCFYTNKSNFFNLPIEMQIRLINYIINYYSKDFKHSPRRKKLLSLLNRLNNDNSCEVIDCIGLQTIEDNLFIYLQDFDLKKIEDNFAYLQDIDKKTRYNIIKSNNLQFLPICIRNRVKVAMPTNKATNQVKSNNFTCYVD